MATPEERLDEAATLAENGGAILHDFSNGEAGRNVTPEPISGPVPTLKEFLAQKSDEIDAAVNAAAVLRNDLAAGTADIGGVEAGKVGASALPATSPHLYENLVSGGNWGPAFNQMFADIDGFAKVVLKPNFVYNSTSIIASTNKNIVYEGNNASIVFSGSGFLLNQGSAEDTLTTVSIDALRGQKTISTSASSGLAPGDLFILWNPNDFSFCLHRDFYRDGEFNIVESVSGNTIKTMMPLRSNYLASAGVKVIKVTPAKVVANNLNVIGSDTTTDAWRLRLVSNYKLNNCNAEKGRDNALRLDRCYNGKIKGGSYICRTPADLLQYGIFCGNSQMLTVEQSVIHGTRHGFATGGQNDLGSVPNRDIFVEKVDASSDLFWSLDMHGNTQNCWFVNCNATLGAGMAGIDAHVVGGNIQRSDGQAPVQFGEIVGGTYLVDGLKLQTAALAAIRPNNSALMALADRDTQFKFKNIELELQGACEGLALISFAFEPAVKWSAEVDNINFSGNAVTNVITLNRLVRSSGVAPLPERVFMQNVYGIPNSAKYTNLLGDWSGAPTLFTLPPVTLKLTASIVSGEFQGAESSVNYPIYPAVPVINASATGAAFANTIATFPQISTAAVGSIGVRLITANVATPAGANQSRSVNVSVSFSGMSI